MEREFEDVPGFDGYRVSRAGVVQSSFVRGHQGQRGPDWRPLKPRPDHHGRLKVALFRNGCPFERAVACLVLEAFVGPCPPGHIASHADFDQANNRLDNLRWVSRHEFMNEVMPAARCPWGDRAPNARLRGQQVLEIRRRLAGGESRAAVAGAFGVSPTCVYDIDTRRTWSRGEVVGGQ